MLVDGEDWEATAEELDDLFIGDAGDPLVSVHMAYCPLVVGWHASPPPPGDMQCAIMGGPDKGEQDGSLPQNPKKLPRNLQRNVSSASLGSIQAVVGV